MHLIALTGTIAAGKTTVADLFRHWGATVLDADAAVHELQRPGTAVFNAIVARFGRRIVAPDGTLDRAALRRRILEDPVDRRDLEAIVHPALELERREAVAAARARGDRVVIADVPLLFEASDPDRYDGIVVVDAPEHERRRRLMEDRHLSREETDQLMALQWPAAAKRARATWIIDNDGDRDALRARALAVWREIAA
jgi:dephospho-CoA kinase